MKQRRRLTLQEAKSHPNTTQSVAELAEVSPGQVLVHAARLNDRLRTLLGYDSDPITITGSGTWRADGVAGVIRLSSEVDLEIVPKFLDPDSDTWRNDFFLLAILVRTGHMLVGEEIAARVGELGDLATLIARTLLSMHQKNQRRPIRRYRRMTRTDFSLDGDVEWESLRMPESDGYRFHHLELNAQNDYNAVLKGAVDTLLDEVGEGDTRAQMHRLSRQLGPQPTVRRAPARLPQRHQPWSEAYALSQLVLEGRGLSLDGGRFLGPGFVLSTWRAWESLCEEVVRRAVPGMRVLGQHELRLGHRRNGSPVTVRPDLAVYPPDKPPLLLDAKYKTRIQRRPAIASIDVYESLAFMRASQSEQMLLLYPATLSRDALELGQWRTFDEVTTNESDAAIRGVEVQVRGLADRGGFQSIVSGARAALAHYHAAPGVADG